MTCLLRCINPTTLLLVLAAVPLAAAGNQSAARASATDYLAQNLPTAPTHKLLVIDRAVADFDLFITAARPGTDVLVIDPHRDGFSQILPRLNKNHDIDQIYIVSHGRQGAFALGSTVVDAEHMAKEAEQLRAIGHSLAAHPEILIYSCNTGAGAEGESLIKALAHLTGATVAASTDLTGANALGGNWLLERATGPLTSTPPWSGETLAAYPGVLVAFTETFSTNPISSPPATSFTRTLGGQSFTFDFTPDGDGGDMLYDSANGADNSGSIFPLSKSFDTGTTEKLVIRQTNNGQFLFSSIFINNSFNTISSVTVGGYRAGVLVGSAQTLPALAAAATLNFGDIRVDEVRITSTDMNINFDNFAGTTINQPPAVATTAGATIFQEANNAVSTPVVIDNGLTVTDLDSPTLASAIVSITGNFRAGEDILQFTNNSATMGNIAGSYNSGTGVLLLTSAGATATVSQWQTALRSVNYTNVSESPNTSTRTVSFVVDDGNSSSAAATKAVSVTAVDDTPTALLLSAKTVNQSAGANAVVGTLSTVDADSAAFTYTLVSGVGSGSNASFSISNSTLRANAPSALAAGTYSIRIRTTDDGGASLDAVFLITVVDDVPPATPPAPDLAPASDSGSSSTDNLTNVTTPTFIGTAEPGATVVLFRAGTISLGMTTATTSGQWSFTVSTPLPEGTHNIIARATDAARNTSAASPALSITIDTTAPAAPSILGITTDTGSSSTDHITSDKTLVFFGTAAANATVRVTRASLGMIGTVLADGAGAWSLDTTATMLSVGVYLFTATTIDSAGNVSTVSPNFTVTIQDAPAISTQPTGGIRDIGTPIVLSVQATGTGPLMYQWFLDGVALTDTANRTGSTTATLTESGRSLGFSGTYTVTISNASGSVTSQPASVVIKQSYTRWAAGFGLAADSQALDPDGDGLNNLLEYALNLTPTVADTRGGPTLTIEGGQSVFRFTRPTWTTGITYWVEFSTDLTTWTPAPTAPTVESSTASSETLVVTFASNGPRQFVRLRISEP